MAKANSIEAFVETEADNAEGECPWLDLSAAESSLALEDFLSFRLTRLAGGIQRNLTRYYAENYQLSVPEWRLLGALVRFSPINFGELLKLSSFDKALISRTITTMKEKGLVETKADPTHKKKLIVSVTASGRATFRQILPQARARQVALLDTLSSDERTVLYTALKKLQGALAGAEEGEASAEGPA
jgi:DNA-binding MarR family transcriptional regulator